MAINIFLDKKKNAERRLPFDVSTPYDGRIGFFAVVTEVHPENNTVHVVTDTGIELMNVGVASSQWVTYTENGKPQLTGERNLPPKGTYVFCIMPNRTYTDCFILCSMFSTASIHADYIKAGDEGANIKYTQENSGWLKTLDIRTGTRKIQNKAEEPTISIEIDQESEGEESAKITVHKNILTVNKDGITIETDGTIGVTAEKDQTLTIKGNANIEVSKDAEIKAQNVKITGSATTEIHGGTVKIAGTVAPTGSGALCGIPSCLFTGAPHVGDTSANA